MVNDHSDSKSGHQLPPHGLRFLISSKGSFICTIQDTIAHTTAFVTQINKIIIAIITTVVLITTIIMAIIKTIIIILFCGLIEVYLCFYDVNCLM